MTGAAVYHLRCVQWCMTGAAVYHLRCVQWCITGAAVYHLRCVQWCMTGAAVYHLRVVPLSIVHGCYKANECICQDCNLAHCVSYSTHCWTVYTLLEYMNTLSQWFTLKHTISAHACVNQNPLQMMSAVEKTRGCALVENISDTALVWMC